MRTFVIGDIHGGLLALEQVLKRAEVNTEDTLSPFVLTPSKFRTLHFFLSPGEVRA